MEREEAGHSDPLRDEAVSNITRQVRLYLDAGQLGQASEVLADALERYPDDRLLETINTAVETARRRQANLTAAPLLNRRIRLLPILAISLVILLVGAILFLARTTGQRLSYAEDAAARPQSAGKPDSENLQQVVLLAIRDHSWDEARTWVTRLSQLKPDDPKVKQEIKEWLAEIDQGSAGDREIAGLRSAAQAAIRARNWNDAETRIALLRKQVPGDPDALEWQKLLSDGRREDLLASETVVRKRQIGALRASIPASIKAKRWNEAQQRITDLQLLVSDDAEAAAWQKALAIIRISELTASAPDGRNETTVTRAPEATPGQAGETAAPPQPKPAPPVPASPNSIIPSSLSLSITPVTPAPTAPGQTMSARIKAIAGRWAYLDPNAPKPQKTDKGLVYAAELVSLDIDANGSGELVYSLKKGALDGTLGTVQFHFWLKGWDGKRLSGLSDSADRDYSLNLEPLDGYLKLEWNLTKRPGVLDRRRATGGTAILTKGRPDGLAGRN